MQNEDQWGAGDHVEARPAAAPAPCPPPLPRWPFSATSPIPVILTSLALSFVVVSVLLTFWMSFSGPLDYLEDPVRVLAAVNTIDREFAEATDNEHPAIRALVSYGGTGGPDVIADRWNRLAFEFIFYGLPDEAEVASLARDLQLAEWGDEEAAALAAATLRSDPPALRSARLPPELADLARQVGSGDLPAPESNPRARHLIALLLGNHVLALAGLVVFVVWLLRGRPSIQLRGRPPLDEFGFGRGVSVFLWAQSLTFIVVLGLWIVAAFAPAAADQLWNTLWLTTGLFSLLIVWWFLMRPRGLGLLALVTFKPSRIIPFILIVFAASGIDMFVSTGTSIGFTLAGHVSPWHMYADELTLFGTTLDRFFSAMTLMVAAPVVEEILFRGVLFKALRARLGVWPAALLSGLLFGAMHGYDAPGFLVVSFSGVLYALLYEHTRSLAPCIAVHAISNAFVFVSLLFIRDVVI